MNVFDDFNNNSVIFLITVIQNELIARNAKPTIDIKRTDSFVPSFLHAPEKKKGRDKLIRDLIGLKSIIENNKHYENGHVLKDKIDEYDLFQIMIAIVYCDTETYKCPLYEFAVADDLSNNMEKDSGNGLSILIDKFFNSEYHQKKANEEIKSQIECFTNQIRIFIKYHKIACLIYDHRLPIKIYHKISDELKENSLYKDTQEAKPKAMLGVMAAAGFDSMKEHSVTVKQKLINEIITLWATKYEKSDIVKHYEEIHQYPKAADYLLNQENFLIAYDYPISALNQADHYRTTFYLDKLNSYLLFWENFRNKKKYQIEIEKLFFLSFHYNQARLLTYKVGSITNPELLANALKYNSLEDFEFAKVKYKQKPNTGENQPEESDTKGHGLDIFEFRLVSQKAFSLLFGFSDSLNSDSQNLFSYLNNLIDRSSNQTDRMRCFPINDYFPLPLLTRFFRIANDYSNSYLVDAGLFDMETVTIKYSGKLDKNFPEYFKIFLPKRDSERLIGNLLYTSEKYLTSYVTNIGICTGYNSVTVEFEKSKDGESPWKERYSTLINHTKYGFELLIKYIEAYMRSHEVNLDKDLIQFQSTYYKLLNNHLDSIISLDEKDNKKKKYSVGIDIGATTIKFKLYESNGLKDLKTEYRLSTKKNIKNESDVYNTLYEFAEKLINGSMQLLKLSNENIKFTDIDAIGIAWPGIIRGQKIAGASGILKNFPENVASNMIRKNTVDGIRNLRLIDELQKVAKQKENTDIAFGLINDGDAEGIGRLFADSRFRVKKWSVIKYGTGTANAILDNGKIVEGPGEFGKLVLNVFQKESKELANDNKTPDGLVNEFVSEKLLQTLFKKEFNLSDDFQITSFEIGKVGEFLLNEKEGNLKDLILNLGVNTIHLKKLEHITSKDIVKAIISLENKSYEVVSKILEALDLSTIQELESKCMDMGSDALFNVFSVNLNKKSIEYEKNTDKKINLIEKIIRENTELKQVFEEKFRVIFTKAGSILSDVIMLIHEYYSINGVILCGGVLPNTITTKIILESTKLHLEKKYFVNFVGIDKFEEDLKKDIIDKKSFTTIYHNFRDDFSNALDKESNINQAEMGALLNAKIVKNAENYKLTKIAYVDSKGNFQGFKNISNFGLEDYQPIVLIGIYTNKKLLYFQRAWNKPLGGEFFPIAGRIKKHYLKDEAIDKLDDNILKKAANVNIYRKLGISIGDESVNIAPNDSENKKITKIENDNHIKYYFAYAVIDSNTSIEIKSTAYTKEKPEEIDCKDSDIFTMMKNILIKKSELTGFNNMFTFEQN